MMPDPAELRPWSRGRWWTVITLVFAAQIGVVLWLEDRSPIVPRKPAAAPRFSFPDTRSAARLAVEDPALFALPHRQGFSGHTWLKDPSLEFQPAQWTEPAEYLLLYATNLAARFTNYVQTRAAPPFPTIIALEPEWIMPETTAMVPAAAPSTLRIGGDLAGRQLLAPPSLPALTNTDLLTNSVVQLLVDARGNTVSAVLLSRGVGVSQQEADQRALDLARTARFAPVTADGPAPGGRPASGLTIGTLTVEWQALPGPIAGAPP